MTVADGFGLRRHARTAGLARPRAAELAAVAVVLGIAAWLRLRDLDIVEFKLDEATSVDIARRLLDGHLPTVGLTSSIGPRDPPFFIYLISIPLGLWDDPRFATAFIGVLAVAAVAMVYALLRPRFGVIAALGASALLATAPWAVLYGRKIWPQDALPIVTASLLWSLFLVLERSRTRAVVLVPALICIAFQLNISALALVVPAAAVLLWRARAVHWAAFAAGVGLAVLLLGPWLLHEIAHGFEDAVGVLTEGRGNRGSSALGSGSVRAIRETIHLSGASDWDYVTGQSREAFKSDAGWAWTAGRATSMLTAGLLALGLVTSAYTVVKGAHRLPRAPWVRLELSASRRALLLAWLGGIWLTYVTSAPGRLAPHYLIVTYPVSFVVQALGLSDLVGARRAVVQRAAALSALGVLAAAAAAFVAFSLSFQHFVERSGGTEGDYGVAYRHKAAIARIVRERGLRVANEPVIDFLVTGRMGSRLGNGPLVRVRNELENDPPLHCDGVVRSSGPLQACLP